MRHIQPSITFESRNTVHQKKPRANELNGKDWLKNSISIWHELAKDSEERGLDHPAIFPWKLAYKIIETFTDHSRKNILDPFVGSGSTLVACQKLNKNGIGFDINKKYLSLSRKRIKKLTHNGSQKSSIKLIHGNACPFIQSRLFLLPSMVFDFPGDKP